MISAPPFDAFANRYPATDVFNGAKKEAVERFFASAANFVSSELLGRMVSGYEGIRYEAVNQAIAAAHRMSAMELGRNGLFQMREDILEYRACYIDDSAHYLMAARAHPADRLTYLEYLLAHCWQSHQAQWGLIEQRLNGFLKASGLRLTLKNLNFVPVEDERLIDEVVEPFWRVVEGGEWANVRKDMQDAFRQRDTGGPNAALLAARALESTIKIISTEQGWTRGNERGAASYIDNLSAGRRYIEQWEANMIKRFFAEVRNPEAHGAGSEPQPKLSDVQAAWALEFCMISIKSLIRRL
jgi:hypothetical protein